MGGGGGVRVCVAARGCGGVPPVGPSTAGWGGVLGRHSGIWDGVGMGLVWDEDEDEDGVGMVMRVVWGWGHG